MILIPFTIETYKIVEDYKNQMPADYRWPSVKDFWFTAVTSLLFMALEKIIEKVCYPCYYKICKEKNNLEMRDMRTRKAV